jgi:hypothetical protein
VERLKPWLPKFYLMLVIAWMLVSSWIAYGLQFFLSLLVIALGFSIILWGTLKIFDLLTGVSQNRKSVKQADAHLNLGDFTIDIPTGHHATNVSHIPHCDGIDLSCLGGFHH